MVTRDRVQGETIRLAVIPQAQGVTRVFAIFKGPSGSAVTTDGVRSPAIVGFPWWIGAGGWIQTDFGPIPPTIDIWSVTQDTSAFVTGQWGAEIWTVDSDGGKSVLTRVSFSISSTLAAATDGDVRSTAAKAVSALEAYLSNPTNLAAGSYKINNRELTRYSLSEVRGLLGYWKTRLREENIRASGRCGVIGRRIEVIF